VRSRQPGDLTNPDPKPSEGSALVHELPSAGKAKIAHDDCFLFAAAIFNSRRVAEAGDSHGSCNASFVELCAVQFREPND